MAEINNTRVEYNSVSSCDDSIMQSLHEHKQIQSQNNAILIDELYSSMSKIIESLSLDNLLINRQIQKLKTNVDELNKYMLAQEALHTHTHIQETPHTHAQETHTQATIVLKKISDDIEELKIQYNNNLLLNNRSLFLQLINDTKKELKQDIKNLENRINLTN